MPAAFDSVWVPTLQGAFLSSYEGVLDTMWTNDIVRRYDSEDQEFLKLVDLDSVGAVKKFNGPRDTTAPRAYVLTQQNDPYEISMSPTVEDVNRDKLGMFETKALEQGQKMADHINKLVIAQLIANPNCFDKTPFFGSTHPGGGGSQVNDVSVTQVPSLDVATAAAPTAVEMSNIILDLIAYFYTFVDIANDPINGMAKKFKLATSNPKVWSAALAATTSLQLSQGLTNPLMAGLLKNGWEVVPALDPRLGTSTTAVFYFFRTDSIVKPLCFGDETGTTFQYLGEGSDLYTLENKYFWGAKAVRSVGVGRWQHSLRCTMS